MFWQVFLGAGFPISESRAELVQRRRETCLGFTPGTHTEIECVNLFRRENGLSAVPVCHPGASAKSAVNPLEPLAAETRAAWKGASGLCSWRPTPGFMATGVSMTLNLDSTEGVRDGGVFHMETKPETATLGA